MNFSHKDNNCFYHGRVINDEKPSTVAVMACQGYGVSGLVMGHGRTIAIKPSLPHVDIDNEKIPQVHDEHLVYHIDDVHRHDATEPSPTECHLGHEMEHVPHHMANLRDSNPGLYDYVVEHHVHAHGHGVHGHDDSDDHDEEAHGHVLHHHRITDDEHKHEHHEHEHEHHEHEHDHHGHDHQGHDHDEDEKEVIRHHRGKALAGQDGEAKLHTRMKEVASNVLGASPELNAYHKRIEKILTTRPAVDRRNLQVDKSKQRYVEMLVVNDPARTITHKGCMWYDVSTTEYIPNACYDLILDTLNIFHVVTGLYRSQSWDYNIQLVITNIVNWWNHACPVDANNNPLNSAYCTAGQQTVSMPPGVHPYRSGSQTPGSYGCVPNSGSPGPTVNGVPVNGPGSGPSTYRGGEAKKGTAGYCEASYMDYLSRWHDWRLQSGAAPHHDNAQLLSYYDFYSTVIGYATLRSMCMSYSGGINQMTYDQEYNAGIIAHEMGHNFGMRHDSDGNQCNPSQYIMASTGSPNGVRPSDFSSCSVNYLDDFFESSNSLVCLDNEPLPPVYSTCGNGFLEQGEQCDCGQSDCTGIDDCCDGSICALKGDNECSSLQPCCSSQCKIIPAADSFVCRTKSDSNTCDKAVETCDGLSAECPFDAFGIAGEPCYVPGVGTESTKDGMCYDGQCASNGAYCKSLGGYLPVSSVEPRVDWCGVIECSGFDGVKFEVPIQEGMTGNWPDGTPCKMGGPTGTGTGLCLMQNGVSTCREISTMLSYQWWAEPFSECSRSCYPSSCNYNTQIDCEDSGCSWQAGVCNQPPPGVMTRGVYCVMRNGTRVSEGFCDGQEKLNEESNCNQFPCDQCNKDCGSAGYCTFIAPANQTYSATTAVQTCVCQHGYSGDNCGTPPSITYSGLTSKKGFNQGLEEDPYCLASTQGAFCDPLVYVGDTIALQWASSGTPDIMAVGVKVQGEAFAFYPDDDSTNIFVDKSSAVDYNGNIIDCNANVTNFLTICDDASFFWNPELRYGGEYTLDIRYNNEAFTSTDTITVHCKESICGAHGTCSSSTGQCTCDEFFTGYDCHSQYCEDWIFVNASIEASEVQSSSYNISRCHGKGTCDQGSGACSCEPDFSLSQYCEVPNSAEAQCPDVNFARQCQHGSVRVLGDGGACDWFCDCQAANRKSSSSVYTHWSGDRCQTCGISCEHGSVDAACTTCENCGTEWEGDRCQHLYWVTNFKLNVDYGNVGSVQKEKFRSTLLKDIAYALNDNQFPHSRFKVYAMQPSGGSTRVYFKIVFATSDTRIAQTIGGDVMSRLTLLFNDPRSPIYRGMLTQYSDSSSGLAAACLPYYENCDPDVKDHFFLYLLICLGSSFGFEILCYIIWQLATQKAKWKRYQDHVHKVADQLKKLQKSNEQQGGQKYFKLRNVSRKRAREIYLAGLDRERREDEIRKAEEAEQRMKEEEDRIEQELENKKKRKRRKKDSHVQPAPGAEGQSFQIPSYNEVMLEPGNAMYDAPGASAPPARVEGDYLPPGWVKYENPQGIPYYYNKKTKKSTWTNPANQPGS